jgi:methylmalonyl-CoA mutase N-terminal domain/subunit
VRALKERRDGEAVERTLDAIGAAARDGENLLPLMVEAVKALATLGEISDVLRGAWGTYDGQ